MALAVRLQQGSGLQAPLQHPWCQAILGAGSQPPVTGRRAPGWQGSGWTGWGCWGLGKGGCPSIPGGPGRVSGLGAGRMLRMGTASPSPCPGVRRGCPISRPAQEDITRPAPGRGSPAQPREPSRGVGGCRESRPGMLPARSAPTCSLSRVAMGPGRWSSSRLSHGARSGYRRSR